MADITTCAVKAIVHSSNDGPPVAGAQLQLQLSAYDIYQGFVTPPPIRGVTDANGECVLELFPNELGQAATFYKVTIAAEGKTFRSIAVVPNQPTALLHEITAVPPYDGKPDGYLVLARLEEMFSYIEAVTPKFLPNAPTNPLPGSRWTDADTGKTYEWVVTASSSAWFETGSAETIGYETAIQAAQSAAEASESAADAQAAEAAANAARDQAVPAAATATAQAGISTAKAAESAASATTAAAAKVAAETARDGAIAAGKLYGSKALGDADTTIGAGAGFVAPLSDGSLQAYRKDSTTTSTAVGAPFPKAADVKGAILGVVGKNKFNKNAITAGYALNDSGVPGVAVGRNISEFIEVTPLTGYRCTTVNKLAWYDASKAFISLGAPTTALTTSPSAAAWARLDLQDAQLPTAQFEIGANVTPYESFRYLSPTATVDRNGIRPREVRTAAIDAGAIKPWQLDDVVFLNMHDGTLVAGLSLSLTDGYTETANAAVDHTDWIAASPSTQYTANEMQRVLFYRDDRSFISVSASLNFTTPSDCRWLRFNLVHTVSFRFQINEGTVATAPFPQPYKYTPRKLYVSPATRATVVGTLARLYTLSDAWYAWTNGDKFPIAMLGDSTTDGNGTTGYAARPTSPFVFGTDVVRVAAHPKVLEDIVRTATGSAVARVYNAGWSGQSSAFLLSNLDAILSGAYADAKMAGISVLNDRTANIALFRSTVVTGIEALIVALFAKGIQPFLVTVQPSLMPSYQTPSPSGSSGDIEAVANRTYRELAQKWNLEIVDLSRFSRDFMAYSAFPLYNPSTAAQTGIFEAPGNVIHFANIGHKYRAELIFSQLCPRVLTTTLGEQLDFSSQFMKSSVDWNQPQQLPVPDGSWKIQAKFTKGDATDILLQDFWLFNNYRGRLNLTAYAVDAPESAYVKLNGVTTTMDAVTKAIGTLEMGLHHIEAWSGATTAVNWRGFKALP